MFARKLFVHFRRQVSERALRPGLAAKSAGEVPVKPGGRRPLNRGRGACKDKGQMPAKPKDKNRSFIRCKKPPYETLEP